MDQKKAYWFEQPYIPRIKNIAVAPVILEDGRLSICVPGDQSSVVRNMEPDGKGYSGWG